MSFFKIKLRKTDRFWTQFIRLRDNFTCARCHKVYSPEDCRNLGVSHFWGRSHESTRFDSENCDLLCTWNCHGIWAEEDRDMYKAFKIAQLGQDGFDRLMLRANLYKHRDDALDLIIIKALLNGL